MNASPETVGLQVECPIIYSFDDLILHSRKFALELEMLLSECSCGLGVLRREWPYDDEMLELVTIGASFKWHNWILRKASLTKTPSFE